MNSPSLSVVVPVYNAESKIGRCLASILCQKVENIEIICVNDGSTDNSLNVLQQYAAKYTSVIKVINQCNKGVSVARNEGMKYAKNDFVMFVDADDYILDGALATGVFALNTHNCDLYVFSMERKSRSGILSMAKLSESVYKFAPPTRNSWNSYQTWMN